MNHVTGTNWLKIIRINNILERSISLTAATDSKNVNSQAKVFRKLLGVRTSGSKKWYPSPNDSLQPIKFESMGVHRKQNNSKQNLRRMNVLNKLFMSHVTDQMATGSIADLIYGKKVQITRVKITPDFTHLHVLWSCKDTSAETSEILDKYARTLRHELSQLRLIGEVPIIKFIKDKTSENLEKITELLQQIDIEDDTTEISNVNECSENLESLSMNQNTFDLNHQEIMKKISVKLKKSTDAWDSHNAKLQSHVST